VLDFWAKIIKNANAAVVFEKGIFYIVCGKTEVRGNLNKKGYKLL